MWSSCQTGAAYEWVNGRSKNLGFFETCSWIDQKFFFRYLLETNFLFLMNLIESKQGIKQKLFLLNQNVSNKEDKALFISIRLEKFP